MLCSATSRFYVSAVNITNPKFQYAKGAGGLADHLHVALAGQFAEGARRTRGGALILPALGQALQQREPRRGRKAEALAHGAASAAAGS